MKNTNSEKSWLVYIIENQQGQLYTGITTDINRRLKEHREGKRGARFFRRSPPVRVCYLEAHPNRSIASKREAEIKKMRRRAKLGLIKSLK